MNIFESFLLNFYQYAFYFLKRKLYVFHVLLQFQCVYETNISPGTVFRMHMKTFAYTKW